MDVFLLLLHLVAGELYHGETLQLMLNRWCKLEKDFKTHGRFDISKIPDIYDCIKYDLLHNRYGCDQPRCHTLWVGVCAWCVCMVCACV